MAFIYGLSGKQMGTYVSPESGRDIAQSVIRRRQRKDQVMVLIYGLSGV